MMQTTDINNELNNLSGAINRLISERRSIPDNDPRAFLIDLNITKLQQELATKSLEKNKSASIQNDLQKYNYLLKQLEKINALKKDYNDLNIRKGIIDGVSPQDIMFFETQSRQLDYLTYDLFKDFDHDLSIDEIKNMIDKLNFEFMQLNMPIDKLISSKTNIDKSKQLVDEINLLEKERSMREKADELRRRIKVIENLPGEAFTPDMEKYLSDLDSQLGDLLAEHDDVIRLLNRNGIDVNSLEDKKKELNKIYTKMDFIRNPSEKAPNPAPSKSNPGAQNPGGTNPEGQNPGGQNPGGQNPGGQNPRGPKPGGQNPGGQNPGGQNPGGQNPGGQNPGGQNPRGQNPFESHDFASQGTSRAPSSQNPFLYSPEAEVGDLNTYPTTTESTFSYAKRIVEHGKEKYICVTESVERYLNNPEKHLVKLVKDLCKDKELLELSKYVQYDNTKNLSNVLSKKRDLIKKMCNLSADQQIYKYIALKSAATPEQIAAALKPNYIYDYNICYETRNPNIFRGAYRFLTGKEIPIRQLTNNSLVAKRDNSFLEKHRAKKNARSYAQREHTNPRDRNNQER